MTNNGKGCFELASYKENYYCPTNIVYANEEQCNEFKIISIPVYILLAISLIISINLVISMWWSKK